MKNELDLAELIINRYIDAFEKKTRIQEAASEGKSIQGAICEFHGFRPDGGKSPDVTFLRAANIEKIYISQDENFAIWAIEQFAPEEQWHMLASEFYKNREDEQGKYTLARIAREVFGMKPEIYRERVRKLKRALVALVEKQYLEAV